MNFNGFTPHEYTRFSSLVEQDDATALPVGVATVARNVTFHLASVRTRDGVQMQFQTPTQDLAISGLASLINQQVGGNTQSPLIFDMGGRLYVESPAGSGKLRPVTDPNGLVALPAGTHMQVAPAYNRGYLAFSDMKVAQGAPAVFDLPTGNLDPYTMRPFGDRWKPNTAYKVGEVVTPTAGTTGNGHTYRCTTAGTSGANEPGAGGVAAWPTSAGGTVSEGTCVWTETTATMLSAAGVGNICVGQRYMVVLFKNRNGYITGMTEASVQGFNVSTGSRQLTIANIPLGPANTAARVLCFTVAGGSTVGDYFYIPANDSVSGVAMTATVINDNITTSATFNFTDQYLLASTKVTSFFRKIQAPNCVDIYYAASLDRMVLTLPTQHLLSLAADPESIYGDTGVVVAGQTDGQNHICWREFKGTQYSLKERSGYVIAPSPDDPSQWSVTKSWDGVGPCGPRAVDVSNAFLCFVHRSGVYVFLGDTPQRISKEISKTWRSINWDFAHLVWVNIDEETQEIRIGVPLEDSTIPNVVLKCNYEESPAFASPIYFSPFIGKEIAAGEARKWSIDDMAAYVCKRVERKITSLAGGGRTGMSGEDALTRQSQIMFASSQPDGAVNAIAPGVFNDNSRGIDAQYECVSMAELMKVNQFGGISVNADGDGDLLVSIVFGRLLATDRSNRIQLRPIKLDDARVKPPSSVGGRGQNERMRPRFSNGNTADAWFDLKYAAIFARAVAQSR